VNSASPFKKISWRLNLLQKALSFPLETDWGGVLRVIFSSHSQNPSYPQPHLLRKENGLGCYQVKEREVWFPLSFDPSFLGFVYEEIFVQKVYECGDCRIHPGDWVVDAGACEGFFSLYALERGANVLAFEPVPEVARALERTLKEYIEAGRAKVFPFGLGREREEKTIFLSSINSGSNTVNRDFMELHAEGMKVNREEQVLITPLDEVVCNLNFPVSFLKADVEGSERELLLGARETIRRSKPRLSICTYHLPDDWREIPRMVESFRMGYRIRFSVLFDHMYGW
jgi:FkbM family methyltransferase